MAWGFHTSTLRPKFNHWGQSVCKKGFDTIYLLEIFHTSLKNSQKAYCKLNIFNNLKK